MEVESLVCPCCGAGLPDNISRGKLFKCANCGNKLVWPERQPTISLRFGLFLCPECGTDNVQSRKYCRLCGTLLHKECPVCGNEFYVGDNYCPNGHNYDLEIKRLQEEERLKQEKLKAASSIPTPVPLPTPSKTPKSLVIVLGILVIISVFVAMIFISSTKTNGTIQNSDSGVTWDIVTKIADEFASQNATASREDLENEIASFSKDPKSLVTVKRIGGDESEYRIFHGIYEIINNSKYSWVTSEADCNSCPFVDSYHATALPTMTYMFGGETTLFPGGSRKVEVTEYGKGQLNWEANDVCIWVTLSNQVSSERSKYCFDHEKNMDLSKYLNYSARLINSKSSDYSGLVEVTFNVDNAISYYPIMLGGQYSYQNSITFEPSKYDPNYLQLYQPDSNDSRVFVSSDNLELLPGTTQRYIYLYNNYVPENICISLSAPYAEDVMICNLVNK